MVRPAIRSSESSSHRDYDRDRIDRDRTTVVKEREPADRTTVIKKEHDEPREKTIIKEHD